MALDNMIITQTNPKSPISEAYRVLRTNIQYSNIDKRIKTIVVTSSEPMEGKTTTVVNLAVTFAQAGNKVLVIDSDLRKPKIHSMFGINNDKGLTNLIAGHGAHKDFIQKVDIDNLSILTSGTIPPNPSELLASNSMKEFLKKVCEEFDIILFDAPPVGIVTDAAIISTYVDGTILVANSGHVGIETIKRSKDLLQKVDAKILGVVMNKLSRSYKKSNYNYSYYYGAKKQGKKM
jgi:capsular exopolysaccharide synthesis family protein